MFVIKNVEIRSLQRKDREEFAIVHNVKLHYSHLFKHQAKRIRHCQKKQALAKNQCLQKQLL